MRASRSFPLVVFARFEPSLALTGVWLAGGVAVISVNDC